MKINQMKSQRGGNRWNWLLCVRVLILALSVLAGVIFVLHGVTQAQQPSASKAPQDVDVILIVDESASMWEKNDPQIMSGGTVKNPGWRIAAVNQLAGALATDQSGAHYQFGLILFGSAAKVVFPLQPVNTAQAQTALTQALLSNHANMSATNILPTLQLAKEQLDKSGAPNAHKLVIYLSDGVCEPVPQTLLPQRRACEDGVRKVLQQDYIQVGGISITTVALTYDAWAPDPTLAGVNLKNLWQEMAVKTGGDYYEAKKAEGDLSAIFTRIQNRIYGLPDLQSPSVVTSPGSQSFKLPANINQVVFTFVANDPGIATSVTRPDGTVVDLSDPGVVQYTSSLVRTISILHPAAGLWRIKSTGAGTLTPIVVPDDRVTPTADSPVVYSIDSPLPGKTFPQYKPMQIRARVVDANNAAQATPDLKIVVTRPGGVHVTPTLTLAGGYYTAQLTDTSKTGIYIVSFSGNVSGQAIADQHTVNVQTTPWLRLSSPQSGVDYTGSVPARAQVLLGAVPMGILQAGDQLQIIAHLINSLGQEMDTQSLRVTSQNNYSATLIGAATGVYTARVGLTYVTAGGDKYDDSVEVPVSFVAGSQSVPVAQAATAVPVPTSIPTGEAAAPAIATAVPPATSVQDLPLQVSLPAGLMPLYIVVGIISLLVILLIIVTLLQVNALNGIRKVFKTSIEQQDMIVKAWHVREVSAQLSTETGWKSIVDQIVADAMQESMSIDSSAGILDLTTEPSPKFTLVTRDGRQVVFTTDPWAMKKMHLILRGDKVIDISAISRVTHLDASLLWLHVQDRRGLPHMVVPANAHWYIVMRGADSRGFLTNSGLLRPGNVPYVERLPKPQESGDRE